MESLKNQIENEQITNCKKNILSHIYAYKKLEIYSPSYTKSIIMNLFRKSDRFAVIYGDFNKLREINNNFGEAVGDICIEKVLSIMKQELPDDAIFFRIGGDEFGAILPKQDETNSNTICHCIEERVAKISDQIHSLSITMNAKDSSRLTEFPDIDSPLKPVAKLISLAEKEVLDIKQRRHIHEGFSNSSDFFPLSIPDTLSNNEKEHWENLNVLIQKAAKEHLSDFRPSSSFNYTLEDIEKDYASIKSHLTERLLRGPSGTSAYVSTKHFEKEVSSYQRSKSLHTFLSKEDPISYYYSLNGHNRAALYAQLYNLQNMLIKNEVGSLLNKSYLVNRLAKQIGKSRFSYHAVYFTAPGIRVANTGYGHFPTDIRINKTTNLLKKAIEDELCLTNTPNSYGRNYLIDENGGNYVLLHHDLLLQKAYHRILNKVNTEYNKDDPNSSFLITAARKKYLSFGFIPSSSKIILRSIAKLKMKADTRKDNLKRKMINNCDYNAALNVTFQDCLEYYRTYLGSSEIDSNIEQDSNFIKLTDNIFSAIYNEGKKHNNFVEEKRAKAFKQNLKVSLKIPPHSPNMDWAPKKSAILEEKSFAPKSH